MIMNDNKSTSGATALEPVSVSDLIDIIDSDGDSGAQQLASPDDDYTDDDEAPAGLPKRKTRRADQRGDADDDSEDEPEEDDEPVMDGNEDTDGDDDGETAVARVQKYLGEFEGTDDKTRRKQIAKGLTKMVQRLDSDATKSKDMAGRYEELAKRLYGGGIESAKSTVAELVEYVSKFYGVDAGSLSGAVPAKQGANAGGSESDDIETFIETHNLAPGEEAVLRAMGDKVSRLESLVEKMAKTVTETSEQQQRRQAEDRKVDEYFSSIRRQLAKTHDGFAVTKGDVRAAIKAYPNYEPEHAYTIHMRGRLDQHRAELGRKTAGKPRVMPSSRQEAKQKTSAERASASLGRLSVSEIMNAMQDDE